MAQTRGLGFTVMPAASDAKSTLIAILSALQPFNEKLVGVLTRIKNGTASPEDLEFHDKITTVFSGE